MAVLVSFGTVRFPVTTFRLPSNRPVRHHGPCTHPSERVSRPFVRLNRVRGARARKRLFTRRANRTVINIAGPVVFGVDHRRLKTTGGTVDTINVKRETYETRARAAHRPRRNI